MRVICAFKRCWVMAGEVIQVHKRNGGVRGGLRGRLKGRKTGVVGAVG